MSWHVILCHLIFLFSTITFFTRYFTHIPAKCFPILILTITIPAFIPEPPGYALFIIPKIRQIRKKILLFLSIFCFARHYSHLISLGNSSQFYRGAKPMLFLIITNYSTRINEQYHRIHYQIDHLDRCYTFLIVFVSP